MQRLLIAELLGLGWFPGLHEESRVQGLGLTQDSQRTTSPVPTQLYILLF